MSLPETLIAVCRLAVLVSEPANMPVALSTLKPNQRAHSRAAPLPATTATAASRLARRPKLLTRPLKKVRPYWMPVQYRNRIRPMLPSSPGGVALGAIAPTARPTNSTAPIPSEKPPILTRPSA